jgi:hypothetical protein
MNRDEFRAALHSAVWNSPSVASTHGEAIDALIDAVAPIIRADERERNREVDGVAAYLAVENALIDLRAKVEDLDCQQLGKHEYVIRDDVLELIDGGSND